MHLYIFGRALQRSVSASEEQKLDSCLFYKSSEKQSFAVQSLHRSVSASGKQRRVIFLYLCVCVFVYLCICIFVFLYICFRVELCTEVFGPLVNRRE